MPTSATTLSVGQPAAESLLARWLKPFMAPLTHAADTALSLARGGIRRVTFAPGGAILCEGGCIWITRDGGGEDIVLHAGDSRQFPRETSLVIEALEPATLTLRRPASR